MNSAEAVPVSSLGLGSREEQRDHLVRRRLCGHPAQGHSALSHSAEPPARKSSPRGFQLGHYFTDYLMGSECTAGLMYPQFSNSRLRLVSWSRFSCHDEVYNFRLRLLS